MGPFVALNGIYLNIDRTKGYKENLLSHLPYKRERGRWRRAGDSLAGLSLLFFLLCYSNFCWLH
jgi:hypothetical protein